MSDAHVDAGAVKVGAADAGMRAFDVDLSAGEIRLGSGAFDDGVVGGAAEGFEGDGHVGLKVGSRDVRGVGRGDDGGETDLQMKTEEA